MFAHCKYNVNEYPLLEQFVDYKNIGKALSFDDQNIVVKSISSLRRSTIGWKICCQWKYGSTSCEKVSYLKESYPVQVAYYAVAQVIYHEPKFNWWSTPVLRKGEIYKYCLSQA